MKWNKLEKFFLKLEKCEIRKRVIDKIESKTGPLIDIPYHQISIESLILIAKAIYDKPHQDNSNT